LFYRKVTTAINLMVLIDVQVTPLILLYNSIATIKTEAQWKQMSVRE